MRRGTMGLLLLAIAAAVTVVATADASAPNPRGWQTLPIARAQQVIPIGWAAGRVWFAVDQGSGGAVLDVWSAKVAGRKLTALVSTPNVGWDGSGFLTGSTLCCAFPADGSTTIAPLLADGKVGDWTPIPGDPGGVARTALLPSGTAASGHWAPIGGVTVAGKTVWLIGGHSCGSGPRRCTGNGGGVDTFAMCCTASGAPTDLGPLFAGEKTSVAFRLGTDGRGRLWLAWGSDTRPTHYPRYLDLQQVDPATLAPTGPRVQVEADPGGVAGLSVVCADGCRFAYETRTGVAVWPGTGAPTKLWSIDRIKDTGGHLLAAGWVGRGLVVASTANKVPTVPDDGQILTVSRTSAAGARVHASASVPLIHDIPLGSTHYLFPLTDATMVTPAGVIHFTVLMPDYGGAAGRVVAAVVR